MGMLEDLTELLIARGVDMGDVVRGPLVDEPVSQTALIPSFSGPPPLAYCGPEAEVHRVAVQVRRADGVESRSRCQAIYDALLGVAEQTSGDSLFQEVIPQSGPFWIDEDVNGAQIYGLNVEVRRSQT